MGYRRDLIKDEDFCRRIKIAILKSNLSVSALARKIGINRGQIYDWINGTEPGAFHLTWLAEACGVSVEWLLTGKE